MHRHQFSIRCKLCKFEQLVPIYRRDAQQVGVFGVKILNLALTKSPIVIKARRCLFRKVITSGTQPWPFHHNTALTIYSKFELKSWATSFPSYAARNGVKNAKAVFQQIDAFATGLSFSFRKCDKSAGTITKYTISLTVERGCGSRSGESWPGSMRPPEGFGNASSTTGLMNHSSPGTSQEKRISRKGEINWRKTADNVTHIVNHPSTQYNPVSEFFLTCPVHRHGPRLSHVVSICARIPLHQVVIRSRSRQSSSLN